MIVLICEYLLSSSVGLFYYGKNMAHSLELSFFLSATSHLISHLDADSAISTTYSTETSQPTEMDWVDFSCVCSESQEFSRDPLCLQIYITRPVMQGARKLFQEMSLDVTICVFK